MGVGHTCNSYLVVGSHEHKTICMNENMWNGSQKKVDFFETMEI